MLIIIQAFINIGVVCGCVPTTGIPLPMISYGGSSFISTMISFGILLNISKSGARSADNMHVGDSLIYE
jgi:cell division protein FtsW